MKTYTQPVYPYAKPTDGAGSPRHWPVIVAGAGPVGLTAAIDLSLLSLPAGALVLGKKDGAPRSPNVVSREWIRFAAAHGLPVVSIQDVIARRMEHETLIEEIARTRFPTELAEGPARDALGALLKYQDDIAALTPEATARLVAAAREEGVAL